MCNIAGYVGREQAAPILLDMIEAQEGLAGGYYTGIATVSEDGLHWAKVVGDTARLRAAVADLDLPGTVGLAHSRSNSGGDAAWAHPFVACDDSLAYVANGARGYFAGCRDTDRAAARLEAAGHTYTAVASQPIGAYPVLPDGRCVHMSDVMAHAIEERLASASDPSAALESAFLELPAEVVGAFVTPSYPGRIFAARYNMPLCAAVGHGAVRIASSPAGLGDPNTGWCWIPPCSVATVHASGIQVRPLASRHCPTDGDLCRDSAREALLTALGDGQPARLGTLLEAVKPLSRRPHLHVLYDPVYELLWELLQQGVVRQQIATVAGATDDLTAPQFRFTLARAD